MADLMHIPILVEYNYESHAAAGAVTGLIVNEVLPRDMPRLERLGIAVVSALAIGTAKEYVLDRHPNNREISPWGIGAAAALSFRFSF